MSLSSWPTTAKALPTQAPQPFSTLLFKASGEAPRTSARLVHGGVAHVVLLIWTSFGIQEQPAFQEKIMNTSLG